MSYEQRRQWRGVGSTKSPQKTENDRCIIHCTDSSDALIRDNPTHQNPGSRQQLQQIFNNALLSWRYFLAVCNNSNHMSACFFLFCLYLQGQVFIEYPIFTTINYRSDLFSRFSSTGSERDVEGKILHLAFTFDIANQRKIYTMHGWTVSSSIIYYVFQITNQLREDEKGVFKYNRRCRSTFMLRGPPTTPLRTNDEMGGNTARVS